MTIPHGTLNGYDHHGCRCEDCRAASRARELARAEARRVYRQARHDLMLEGWLNPPHGTHATYCNFACRCGPCRQAHRDVMRARRHPVAAT